MLFKDRVPEAGLRGTCSRRDRQMVYGTVIISMCASFSSGEAHGIITGTHGELKSIEGIIGEKEATRRVRLTVDETPVLKQPQLRPPP